MNFRGGVNSVTYKNIEQDNEMLYPSTQAAKNDGCLLFCN